MIENSWNSSDNSYGRDRLDTNKVSPGPITVLWPTGEPVLESNISSVLKYEHYQIIWTGEVLFRVVTLVIVMFFTLVGNITLILTIMCYPRQRRRRVNIFLVNLALGDLMVCLFTMTTEILFVAFGSWVMGAAACKIIVYGQIVTLASATFLLTGMSIDRYQVLVQPLRSLAGRTFIWRKVMSAWILAFLFAIPQLFIFVQTNEGIYPDGSIRYLCRSQGYTAKWQRKLYFTFLTSYIYVIPFIIMSFCYINIIKVVWKRTSDTKPDEPRLTVRFSRSRFSCHRSKAFQNGSPNDRAVRRRSALREGRLIIPKKLVSSSKRKVVKMTLSVIIGFLICWGPYFVISLIRIYSDYRFKMKAALPVAEIMALVHSALNPILYGIFSSKLTTSTIWGIIKCTYQSGSLEKIDETSEDETTWTECKRYSMEMSRNKYGQPSRWRRPCLRRNKNDRPYGDATSITFYHELLPNGHTETVTETDSYDTDMIAQDRSEYHRVVCSGRRRSTVSLVFSNPGADSTRDSISAL